MFFLMLLAMVVIAEAQNNSCGTAQFVCLDSSNLVNYPAGVNAGFGQSGPNYGCLGSEPNPAWFFVKVSVSGDIEIHMQGTLNYDIDFACWGPFNSLISPSPCLASLTAGLPTPNHLTPGPSPDYPTLNMVDCSYSAQYQEWCYIPNAIVGKFYLLMITNYSNYIQNITFSQSNINQPGAGKISCNQNLTATAYSNGPVCQGDSLKLFAPYCLNAQYSWIGPNNFISYLQNPVIHNVTTLNSGSYQLILIDSLQQYFSTNLQIQIKSQPISAFQYSTVFQDIVFSNVSLNSDSSYWSFGDGNYSTLYEPWHNYTALGVYTVSLISYNLCGIDTATDQIVISSLSVNETEKQSIFISPNPSKGIFNVKIPENINAIAYEVMNAKGEIIDRNSIRFSLNRTLIINLSDKPNSIYYLKIHSANKPYIFKLVKN